MSHPLPLGRLVPFDEEADLTVVIETPKGSRNKYGYDPRTNGFKLNHILPAGTHFPFDFGFIPSTEAEDGDPLDVLILMDAPAFVGCVLRARLLGVIEAEQEDEGGMVRNDRLVAVASRSRDHALVAGLDDLPASLLDEIEGFFEHYNRLQDKAFKVLGRGSPEAARRLVEKAHEASGRT